jgi:hypothetical protein
MTAFVAARAVEAELNIASPFGRSATRFIDANRGDRRARSSSMGGDL